MDTNINIRSTYVDMTPELAQKYLDTQVLNRPVSYHWVAALADTIDRGLWTMDGNSIKMDENGHLIDGQHRLRAVIRSGKTVPMEVKSGFPHESIYVIDAFTKTRTAADVLALDGIKNSSRISAAIRVFLEEMENVVSKGKIAPNYIKMVYEDAPDTWQRVVVFARRISHEDKDKIQLLSAKNIAGWAGYLVIINGHSYDNVENFFSMLCSTNEAKNINVEKLRRILLRNAVSTKKYTRSALRSLVAKTWNAYITGKTIKCLKYAQDEENVQFI